MAGSRKDSRQAAARDARRTAFLSDKRSKNDAGPFPDRREPTATEFVRLLVVTEGVNTEVSYFTQFRLPNVRVRAVGTGYNTVSLVRRAEAIRDEEARKGREYDQVWCVFDKDDFSDEDFNEAIRLAEKLFGTGRVAWSNQSFEYWLLLHFLDHQGGAMHRRQYDARLNECLEPHGVVYEGRKRKRVSPEFFDLLLAVDPKTRRQRTEQAITRAERVLGQHESATPATAESSTTVSRLVRVILDAGSIREPGS